jgi:hypothetical protein
VTDSRLELTAHLVENAMVMQESLETGCAGKKGRKSPKKQLT